MPPAARRTDLHLCSMHPVPDSPTSGMIVGPELPTVNIGRQPAAREGDEVRCIDGGVEGRVLKGEPTVRIGGKPAARLGDPIGHEQDPITGAGVPSGRVTLGCPTVWIGSPPLANLLQAAAKDGASFCEELDSAPDGPFEGERV